LQQESGFSWNLQSELRECRSSLDKKQAFSIAGRLVTMQKNVKTGIPGVPLLCDLMKRGIEEKKSTLVLNEKQYVYFKSILSRFLSAENASLLASTASRRATNF
jgi:hypothetical protein